MSFQVTSTIKIIIASVIMIVLEKIFPYKKNQKLFPYEWEGNTHYWKPDFFINGMYVEIKGIETEQEKAKWQYFTKPLRVLKAKEIKPYLDYAVKNYGTNFTEALYEKVVS